MSRPVIRRPSAGTTRVSAFDQAPRAARARGHVRRTRRRCGSRAAAIAPPETTPPATSTFSSAKVDEQIAVRVRRRQIAVIDPPAARTRASPRRASSRSASRPRAAARDGPRTSRTYTRLRRYIARLLVREDLAARAADELVRAGLLGMPVRVDQRLDSVVARRGVDGAQQRVGVRGKPAVDHQRAVVAAQRDARCSPRPGTGTGRRDRSS